MLRLEEPLQQLLQQQQQQQPSKKEKPNQKIEQGLYSSISGFANTISLSNISSSL
jgi:predicted HTH transcriptional regulator